MLVVVAVLVVNTHFYGVCLYWDIAFVMAPDRGRMIDYQVLCTVLWPSDQGLATPYKCLHRLITA